MVVSFSHLSCLVQLSYLVTLEPQNHEHFEVEITDYLIFFYNLMLKFL